LYTCNKLDLKFFFSKSAGELHAIILEEEKRSKEEQIQGLSYKSQIDNWVGHPISDEVELKVFLRTNIAYTSKQMGNKWCTMRELQHKKVRDSQLQQMCVLLIIIYLFAFNHM
jgi:hypothetical protein